MQIMRSREWHQVSMQHPLTISEAVALTLGMGSWRGKRSRLKGETKWVQLTQKKMRTLGGVSVMGSGSRGEVQWPCALWSYPLGNDGVLSLHLRLTSKQRVWKNVTLQNNFLWSIAISLLRGRSIILPNLYLIFQLIMAPPSQFPHQLSSSCSMLWIITGCWSSDP